MDIIITSAEKRALRCTYVANRGENTERSYLKNNRVWV